jgi:hypothetical protein
MLEELYKLKKSFKIRKTSLEKFRILQKVNKNERKFVTPKNNKNGQKIS